MNMSMADLLREAAGDGAAGGGAARSDTRATPEHDGTFSYDFVRPQGTPPEHGEEQAAKPAALVEHPSSTRRVRDPTKMVSKATARRWKSRNPPEKVAAKAAAGPLKGSSRKWTSTEDDALDAWHAAHPNDWVGAGKILGKTNQACRKRWLHRLDPGINWEAWSAQEKETFQNLFVEHGKRWVKIASLMPGRTELQCKNHFNSQQRTIQRTIQGTRRSGVPRRMPKAPTATPTEAQQQPPKRQRTGRGGAASMVPTATAMPTAAAVLTAMPTAAAVLTAMPTPPMPQLPPPLPPPEPASL
jgi:hypothetical protein